jgi:hypothetical protein
VIVVEVEPSATIEAADEARRTEVALPVVVPPTGVAGALPEAPPPPQPLNTITLDSNASAKNSLNFSFHMVVPSESILTSYPT